MNINKALKVILTVLFNVITIFIFIFLVMAIYGFIQVNIQKKEYVDIFGYTFFEIETGSMENTLNIGDAVIVKLTKNISENDIIVYKSDNNYITHRVIKIEDEKIITKGDNNTSNDEPITRKQVCGKVCKILPNLNSIKRTFSSPIVLIAIFITITLLGIAIFYKPKEKMEGK